MIKKLLRKDTATRHMLTLMSGTAVAQAIPLAASPILTRLYTPDDFGLLSLFMAVTSVLGVAACGRYELAIQLAEDDEEATTVAALSLLIALGFSAFLLIAVFLLNSQIAHALGNIEIAPWLYLVPISVFLSGLTTVLTFLNSRSKCFNDLAVAGVFKSSAMIVVQVLGGVLKQGIAGLIIGQISGLLAANGRLFRNSVKDYPITKDVSCDQLREAAVRYSNQPKFTLWASLANAISLNIASVLIINFYSMAALGQYSLVQRVLAAPAALIGNAVGQVFFQRASASRRGRGTARRIFLQTSVALFFISLPIYTFLYFTAEHLFAFVFGEQWRIAGRYAQIMIPLFAVRFVVSSVSIINQVNRQDFAGMAWQMMFLGGSVIAIVGGGGAGCSMEEMLRILSVLMVAIYLLFYLFLWWTTE